MSGHSKWHNIQKRKGAVDAKKGQAFTKIVKNISVAAKEGGGDAAFNFSLRMAVDEAKAANMPKDKIQAAIDRGTGAVAGAVFEEVVYEGYGPGGAALLIKCLTDNRNRTVAEVKNTTQKNGGNIGASGSVMWMFEHKGILTVADNSKITDHDNFELALIDAGAQDIQESDGVAQVYTEIKDLQKVSEAMEKLGVKPDGMEIGYRAKNTVKVEEAAAREALRQLVEVLEELDDVDTVYTNEA